MEYQRILCTFLHHSPSQISQSTHQVLPALLSHCYNPEGLSRSIVATIARELTSLNEDLQYGLSIEEVQNYWFAIALDYQPAAPVSGPGPSSLSTPVEIRNTPDLIHTARIHSPTEANAHHIDIGHLNGAFSHSLMVAHHLNPKVDQLLATAYNNVIFTWITDFLLYPMKKRADLLIPRHRTRPLPRRSEFSERDDDSSISRPSRRLHRLPRRTPSPTANVAADVTMQIEEEDAGLEGCKAVNDVIVDADYSHEYHRPTGTESAYAQWDGAEDDGGGGGEDLFGEALDLRVGKYREKLKHDLVRRDGPLCAASKQPSEALFCTQIIPESADPNRFSRFRRMVSVFFAGQYDHLLGPPQSQSGSTSNDAMEVDHSLGPSPSLDNRRSKRQGHYPTPDNILRTSRNAINLSEKWMRWLDEGRFTIRERGGQFYIICLDPTLYHDPSFSRQGIHPNDSWESAHWLRLEIGATGARNEASNHLPRSSCLAPIIPAAQNEGPNSLPPLHSITSAHLSQHQLPTPTPTPTSPPPISSLPPLDKSHLPRMAHSRLRGQNQFIGTGDGMQSWGFGGPLPRVQDQQDWKAIQDNSTHKRTTPVISISTRLLKRAANRSSSLQSHPYAPKALKQTSPSHSRWQYHSELHDIHNQAMDSKSPSQPSARLYLHSRSPSASSMYSASSTTTSLKPSIASLLNPLPTTSSSTAPSLLKNPTTSSPTAVFTVPAVRKELWDVDALDLNLVRLHEQIVTTWWSTGLAPEVNTQMNWVDNLPLPEINMVVLGEPGFTSVLKHKLTLL